MLVRLIRRGVFFYESGKLSCILFNKVFGCLERCKTLYTQADAVWFRGNKKIRLIRQHPVKGEKTDHHPDGDVLSRERI